MAAAALKIQSKFRGKKFGKRKGASDDGDSDDEDDEEYEFGETQSSSANDSGNSRESGQEEERSMTDGIEKSFDRPMSYSQFNSDENNSRTASAVFSGEQSPMETLCREDSELNTRILKDDTLDENLALSSSGGSGDDRDSKPNSRDRFFMSIENENKDTEDGKYSPETGELIQSEDSVDNIDISQAKNSAEAMFYTLKNDEIESQRLLAENIDEEEDSMLGELVKVEKVSPRKLPRSGMSLDEKNLYKSKLLGLSDSIPSQDYPTKNDESPEEFDPFSHATKQKEEFLDQMHGRSTEKSYDKEMEMGEEDQFDDFYPGNIRQKMMASSISIADSDFYDHNKIPAIHDDIKTALETIHSTDSESTINSAATKIQAGARGFLTRRRLHSTNASTSQYASFGNAAIDKSLDDFIERQEEQLKEVDEEDETEISSKSSKKLDSVDDSIDYSDDKNYGKGVIEIKLEQKKPEELKQLDSESVKNPSNLGYADTAVRRMTLHREDAIQRNSTPSSDESLKTPYASGEQFIEKSSSTQETVVELRSSNPEQRRSAGKRTTKEGMRIIIFSYIDDILI